MHAQRFTYQVVELKGSFWGLKSATIQDELNRLGAQGWELVSIEKIHGMHPLRLFLKKAH